MKKYDVVSDVCKICALSKTSVDKLIEIGSKDICHCVYDNPGEVVILDIGIGRLSLGIEGDEIKYKFIPSPKMENMLKETLQNKKDLLTNMIEDRLTNRLLSTYKDLF